MNRMPCYDLEMIRWSVDFGKATLGKRPLYLVPAWLQMEVGEKPLILIQREEFPRKLTKLQHCRNAPKDDPP